MEPTPRARQPGTASADGLFRRLVWLYVKSSLAAVAVTFFLALLGLEFTPLQWGLFLAVSPFGIAFYVGADIYLIWRHFEPIRIALSRLDKGETPDAEQASAALVRALNLPFYSFLRITFAHGPMATAAAVFGMEAANFFGAEFGDWQVIIFAIAVMLFASPTHAILEYFGIARDMIVPITRISASIGSGILPEHQQKLVSVLLRSKLLYLAVFIAALPLIFFACSILFKVQRLFDQAGFAPSFAQMLPLWFWVVGVVGLCLALALMMAIMTASDVSHSAGRLSEAMGRVEAGQLDADLSITTTDEYAGLFRGFNHMVRGLRDEVRMLEVTRDLAGELQLDALMERILSAASDLLDAERATLFVHDPKTDELCSRYAAGIGTAIIRIPSTAGIAGRVFTSGIPENIPDAYAEPSFDKAVDASTGYHTRNILCMPIINKSGTHIGVTEVLNKRGLGSFTAHDQSQLEAFTAQIAVLLENAQLFDEVLSAKNYIENILRSTSNGIVTVDKDGVVVTANDATLSILKMPGESVVGVSVAEIFNADNAWVTSAVGRVASTGQRDLSVDASLRLPAGEFSVNMTAQPLFDPTGECIGSMLVFEDISEEHRVRTTMARYMSKEVVDQLLVSGESVLGGTTQTVSILFSDIRNFTTLSEGLGARDTVNLLNDYFAEMVGVVIQNGGILDKYIGDAIMALFGAPFGKPDDADRALAVANGMLIALRELNRKFRDQGRPTLKIGVGVATGEVVVGNIGSPLRMEYTVIGDKVNIASRLEGANKYYGTGILMDDATVASLNTNTLLREIDLLRVKGKDRPVAVYEALTHHDAQTFPMMMEVLDAFNRGLLSYRAGDWQRAMVLFEAALRLHPGDGPSAIYLERCRIYRDNPPPPNWGGVWVLTDK